jgi:hypothetical protein
MPKRMQKREEGSKWERPPSRARHPDGSLQVLPHRFRLTDLIKPVRKYL